MQLRQQALEEERLRKERDDEEAKVQVFDQWHAVLIRHCVDKIVHLIVIQQFASDAFTLVHNS